MPAFKHMHNQAGVIDLGQRRVGVMNKKLAVKLHRKLHRYKKPPAKSMANLDVVEVKPSKKTYD